MTQRSFTVRALWDEEARTYYSESDIIGLHIEAEDLDAFEQILFELAPELIVANHMQPELIGEITPANLAEHIPAIVWQRPAEAAR